MRLTNCMAGVLGREKLQSSDIAAFPVCKMAKRGRGAQKPGKEEKEQSWDIAANVVQKAGRADTKVPAVICGRRESTQHGAHKWGRHPEQTQGKMVARDGTLREKMAHSTGTTATCGQELLREWLGGVGNLRAA